mmetsp:Transcript_14554/g.43459  ORF Transcript_14554/g.43459 Transcript_14554/m.43459 type:complete len:289 (+) Transcript_14554:45-911(+)
MSSVVAPEAPQLRMRHLRDHLGRLHDLAARPVEEAVPVRHEAAALADRAHGGPHSEEPERPELAAAALHREATRRDDEHVRLVEGRGVRERGAVTSLGAVDHVAARLAQELLDPVAAAHERPEPLDVARRAPRQCFRRGPHLFEAAAHGCDEPLSALRHAERRSDGPHVSEDVAQRRRLDGHDALPRHRRARRLQVGLGDGADAALVLSQDHVRLESCDGRVVDLVDWAAVRDDSSHRAVDYLGRRRRIHFRCCDHRQRAHRRRRIAAVRASDECVRHAEPTDDFRAR